MPVGDTVLDLLSNGISSITYRGTTYNSSSDPSFSQTPTTHMINTYGFQLTRQVLVFTDSTNSTPDADVEDLVDAGVHVCIGSRK